jgi:hypothetical protein
MGRQQRDSVAFTGQTDIIHIAPLPADKALVLDPAYRLSDSEFRHRRPVVVCPIMPNFSPTQAMYRRISSKTQFGPPPRML